MFLDVKRLLLSRAELAAMVSGIYPGFVPESKSIPALSALIVSEIFTDALDDSAALNTQNWQINAVAKTAQEADAIAREVVAALHKQSGAGISRATVTNRRDEPPTVSGIHRVIIEVTINQ